MKRIVLLLVVVAASVSLAQDHHRRIQPTTQPSQSQPMPVMAGSGFLTKVPKLRSYVTGWALTGSKPEAYEIRCDDVFTDCAVPILRTKTWTSEPYGMGSLSHSETAAPWRGSRVELSADLRAGRIDGWAGLWMRIDGPNGEVLAFDNMQTRPLRGTTSFQWYSVVLDVPPNAERISFGVMLHGPGAVFVRELRFEAVNQEVSSTDLVGPLRAQVP